MTAENLITLKISNGALKSEKLPARLKIFGWGANETVRGTFRAGDKTASLLSANQRALGYDRVAIDFDHCTVAGTETHSALLKAGQPPLIFGYGRVNALPGDGIYLEDITWTPLGAQHARNFEDLSPAIKDDAGEVVLIHSVALTPNGAVKDLQFFTATPQKNMSEKYITLCALAAILNLKADADEAAVTAELQKRLTPASVDLTPLSARITTLESRVPAGADLAPLTSRVTALEQKFTAGEQAATDAKRGDLITLFARNGKVPKKADGSAYTAEEMKALDVGTLQLLHANTPVTVPLSARNAAHQTEAAKSHRYKVGDREVVDLAGVFQDENVRAGLTSKPNI